MHVIAITLFSCALLGAAAAQAQLIRPDSATATSTFSSSYSVNNTINGSGLPAGFTLTDAHATYAVNNHWTTQAGHTIGESATFTFNTAQTLGAFHMWNHRSNGIASNAYYEPVLFDLVIYDGPNGTGATLGTFANIPALPNVATAQTMPFKVTEGVRSVKFIVRATENGNISPYTGLAEVAFGPCVPVEVRPAGRPVSVAACPAEPASFAVVPYGSGNFSYRWQWRDQDASAWMDVNEGANSAGATAFTAVGATAQGVVAFPSGVWSVSDNVSFRVIVSNPCSEVPTAPVRLAIDPADVGTVGGTPGRDHVYDNNDFIVFIDYFFSGNPLADVGSTGGVFGADGAFDNNDFVAFINEFFNGC